LELIPEGYPLRFDPHRWRDECEVVDARDNDPAWRDEQRAWYDALRDLMPPQFGLGGTSRIIDQSRVFCAIDSSDAGAVEGFRQLVDPSPTMERASG